MLAKTFPLESLIVTVEFAFPEAEACSHPCEELVEGDSAIPEEPMARSVPPLTKNSPFESSAPFPPSVGP